MQRTEPEELRAHFVFEGRTLEVVVTHEGVIMDAYRNDEHIGTRGMTADEWFAFVIRDEPKMIDGPAITGLLTILHDRGYSEALAEHALYNYGEEAAFELLAQAADQLERAFEAEPARECDECGKVELASGFLDWVNGACEECDPSILKAPENVARLKGEV